MTVSIHPEPAAKSAEEHVNYPSLKGKSVIITGAASGIGLALAEAFAANDGQLTLLDINAEGLTRASQKLKTAHPGVAFEIACCSTTDEAAVEHAFGRAEALFGSVDVLLNNAGVASNKPTLDLSLDEWRRVVDINLTGVFVCAQAAGRRMTRKGRGVILNTASMFGISAAPNRAAYCATKAAVVSLTKVLAVEWATFGVRVNALAPGYVGTALVEELVRTGRLDPEALKKRTPLGRLAKPLEIAQLALFLASDQAAYITGQAIVADGGWTANGYA
jgi:NAD(P)-dependent dehydrogenase (short-subunit alcohol dehydrogenase family)